MIASHFEAGEYAFDPLTMLPIPLPPLSFTSSIDQWYSAFLRDVDSILYSSNQHHCGKGCQRIYNSMKQCQAHFPREIIPETIVDLNNGALRFKKLEPFLNTFNPVLTYCFRCNTDVTCMLSGTHARAVVAYISDYITKTPLSAHAVFEAVLNVLGHLVTCSLSINLMLTRLKQF
ncbi:uncharacterized protein LAESUDRAFT_667463 [Laetiporus sulphureus 93-53]|uniref:Uncharacterized protein n=1 Tax=Laetiporus sulphureus 93-53 TaxID=1314785 RepID=A0A165AXU5_9APHY|nr:uncharacterized protein LAESUDRAFT_667463 [Laetiporus sulphureus 93-53]KZS99863.1 hypothetical protein LAESUDRAFT_667463 [Laetiporus sulphureus 93-53]